MRILHERIFRSALENSTFRAHSQGAVSMKKLFVFMLMILLLLLSTPAAASGAEANGILEAPDIRIIMDGKLTPYKDVPVTTGQRTLLPLREMLVNLGVPNDDEHIIYNELEKSVTVRMDQTRIYLAEGNKTAYVNEQPVTLDAAPVLYKKNGRMYIPLRFVAEALEKKVVWDGTANSIYICDADAFEQTKELLGKADEAMKLTLKCRQAMDADVSMKTDPDITNIDLHVETQIDKTLKKMSMGMRLEMPGIALKSDAFYADGASYVQDILTQKWQKKNYPPSEYDELFAGQSGMTVLDITESLCAGLTRVADAGRQTGNPAPGTNEPAAQSGGTGTQAGTTAPQTGGAASPTENVDLKSENVSQTAGNTAMPAGTAALPTESADPPAESAEPPAAGPILQAEAPDEILLRGDVFLTGMFDRALAGQDIKSLISPVKSAQYEAFHIELSINPHTGLMNRISMNVGMVQKKKEDAIRIDMDIRILYSEYNGGFEIIIPQNILDGVS